MGIKTGVVAGLRRRLFARSRLVVIILWHSGELQEIREDGSVK